MYIEREIKGRFEKITEIYSLIALVGARQSGKTTFLKKQSESTDSLYLSFDDPDVRNLFEKDVKKFEKQYLDNHRIYIFDEIQNCKNAGINLKYLADKGHKIWLTSSSEIILSKEVLSYLVGRVSVLKLFPFSFKEFLDSKKQKEFTKQILERSIWEHVTYGGYPKVAITDNVELKKIILKDLYQTMVLKDISQTFSIEDVNSLEEFTRYLSFNIGNLISYNEISNKLNLSFKTVKKYLDSMEKSYLIFKVPPFYKNKSKEISKQPKFYFIDTGLRNLISKEFDSEFGGKVFENYVASELAKLGYSLKHWRTKSKAEVDFIIEKEKEIIPIEVKLSSPKKVGKSLRSFIKKYKPERAMVVFYKGKSKIEEINGCKLNFVNVSDLKKELGKF